MKNLIKKILKEELSWGVDVRDIFNKMKPEDEIEIAQTEDEGYTDDVRGPRESDRVFVNGYLKDVMDLTKKYSDEIEKLGDVDGAKKMRKLKPHYLMDLINKL
jgi:hypothetical protein